MTFLANAVRKAARDHGHAVALVAERGPVSLTFEQLNAASEALAARLAVRGIGHGQMAALLLPSSLDYIVAYCALAKVGAVTAGIGAHYSPGERAAMLERVKPSVVIGTEDLLTGRLPDAQIIPVRLAQDRREFAGGLPILGREHAATARAAWRIDAQHSTVHGASRHRQDPETVVFTSGTTGQPKGALFCAKQISAITAMDVGGQSGQGGQGGPMPLLVATGLNHVGFMTRLAGHLLAGNRLHVMRHWRAADALDLICAEKIAVLGGVAAQVALLLRVPDLASRDLSGVKALIIGGGPSPADLVRQARTTFGAAYSIRYSSTESGGLGTLTAFDAPDDELFHTVGRPRPGTEVSIRDEAGVSVPPGETGEVWLRAESVMAEYWHDPEATLRTLTPDGWLRTGDLGRLDGTAALRLAGRRDDMFIRGGYNVHPQEVEAVLQAHPGVGEVAVVPRDDPVMGQVGVAFVVPSRNTSDRASDYAPDHAPQYSRQSTPLNMLSAAAPAENQDPATATTLDDLRAFAAHHLARHKLPDELRVVDRLPLTSGQKVDRSALRKLMEL
jgi:acyl-CoA synthetase (AMP-forming)/AMP-acid ligase II